MLPVAVLPVAGLLGIGSAAVFGARTVPILDIPSMDTGVFGGILACRCCSRSPSPPRRGRAPSAPPERAMMRAMRARGWDRAFHVFMALAIAATVFAGFAPSFYLRGAAARPLPALVVAHGVLFSAWILILLLQVGLVTARRVDLHRRVGLAGVAVATLMVVVGSLVALVAARRDFPRAGHFALEFLIVPLGDMVAFGTLAGVAFQLRRRAEAHKRLILLATIALLPAAVARLPIDYVIRGGEVAPFVLVDLFVAACVLWDLVTRRGRVHPALAAGGAFLVASQALRLWLGGTAAWQALARWLVT